MRTDIASIDTQDIIELVENYGITGAAERLNCSRSGLTYQMKQRGIPKPPMYGPRTRTLLRKKALARYGYPEPDKLIEMLQQLGQELGRRPIKADLDDHADFPSRYIFEDRFGNWTNALKKAGFDPTTQPNRQIRRRQYERKPTPPLKERVYKSVTPRLRFAILERDGFRCVYCGKSPRKDGIHLEMDHVIPESKGGLTTYDNLVACCSECNQGKSNHYESTLA